MLHGFIARGSFSLTWFWTAGLGSPVARSRSCYCTSPFAIYCTSAVAFCFSVFGPTFSASASILCCVTLSSYCERFPMRIHIHSDLRLRGAGKHYSKYAFGIPFCMPPRFVIESLAMQPSCLLNMVLSDRAAVELLYFQAFRNLSRPPHSCFLV